MCSLCHLKLLEMLTNLSKSFFETLTVIVREAVPSESKISFIKMLLLSTQLPRADNSAIHVPVVARGSTRRISAFAPLSMRPILRLMGPSLLTCQLRFEMSCETKQATRHSCNREITSSECRPVEVSTMTHLGYSHSTRPEIHVSLVSKEDNSSHCSTDW